MTCSWRVDQLPLLSRRVYFLDAATSSSESGILEPELAQLAEVSIIMMNIIPTWPSPGSCYHDCLWMERLLPRQQKPSFSGAS